RVGGRARPGGEQHAVVSGDRGGNVGRGNGVVADDVGVRAEFLQIGVERVDEAVVIVDDEDAGHTSPPTTDSSTGSMLCTQGNTQRARHVSTMATRTMTVRMRTQRGP